MRASARSLLAATACAAAFLLGGCAVALLGPPVPSIENIGKVRAAGLPPLALGSFTLAEGKAPSLDQWVVIRSNRLHSPVGGSFAAYLKEAIAADLRAAGRLDPGAPVVVTGQLTDNQIELPMGTANATIAARFQVRRSGASLYDKELRARSEWQAPFNGFEAVPMAVNHYEVLYRKLTATLLEDPEFRAAVTR